MSPQKNPHISERLRSQAVTGQFPVVYFQWKVGEEIVFFFKANLDIKVASCSTGLHTLTEARGIGRSLDIK